VAGEGEVTLEGRVGSIWRHPVKGFTPEPLETVELAAAACFPGDRLYAVEDGPSGFDPAAPAHISKQRFAVLATTAALARIRTRYDEATGVLEARIDGGEPHRARLTDEPGRAAFAAWLTGVLGEDVRSVLKVLPAPANHRFMDHPKGAVSIVNLASVRDLAQRIGRPVDPRRFRANIYVEGWPAWIEAETAAGDRLALGAAEVVVLMPIVRCVATHVDPDSGEKDIDVVRALFEAYGHRNCGIYVAVDRGGRVSRGDRAVWTSAGGAG
jgi:uncharacterized protein YcbX